MFYLAPSCLALTHLKPLSKQEGLVESESGATSGLRQLSRFRRSLVSTTTNPSLTVPTVSLDLSPYSRLTPG